MTKCWIHGQTAKTETPKPLKTHPSHPDPNFRQDLALCLAPKPQIRDLAIQPYRHWEFEVYKKKISGLEKTLKTERENGKKREEELLEEIDQWEINYQFLNEEKNREIAEIKLEKNEEITELNNRLNQLITRIMNISEAGTFDPELKKQKGIKELLERYEVKSLEELVAYIEKIKEKEPDNEELKEQLEKEVRELQKENEKLKESRDAPPDYEELEGERDLLKRTKWELEQENLTLNNRLKNKSQEVQNKYEAIERLKREKSQSEMALNKTITELRAEIKKIKKEEEAKKSTRTITDWWNEAERITYEEYELLTTPWGEPVEGSELLMEEVELDEEKEYSWEEIENYLRRAKKAERGEEEKKRREAKLDEKMNDGNDWGNISLDFRKEGKWTYKRNWVGAGFTYESCKEWIDVGMKADNEDFMFCAWLRNEKNLTPQEVLNFGSDKKLREEWRSSLHYDL